VNAGEVSVFKTFLQFWKSFCTRLALGQWKDSAWLYSRIHITKENLKSDVIPRILSDNYIFTLYKFQLTPTKLWFWENLQK